MIGGLLLHDHATEHERWNCSGADLRRHVANEIMKPSLERQNNTIHDSGIHDMPFYEGGERRPF